MNVYTTKRDAIEQNVMPALGTDAHDYDMDAIFDEAFEYDSERCGFVQTVTVEEFWAIVAKHDHGDVR